MALGQVIDRLVTEFTLKDDYTPKAAKITAATATMKASLGNLGTITINPIGMSVFTAAVIDASVLLNEFSKFVTNVFSLFGGMKALSMAQPFLDAASAIDTMKRQLSAMLGSAAAGNNAFKWVQQYGLTSGMTDAPLLETMRTILLSGRRPGKLMPVLESLALMGSGSQDANMMDMASIFRRLVGGQIADALGPEGLGRFGVNRQMLGQYGAKFNNQGQFVGTVDDALAVLERMVALDPRIKDLKASMDTSLATRLSNLANAFDIAKASIGESIANWLVPKLEMLGTVLTKMARSGMLGGVMDKMLSMFGLGGKEGMAKGLVTTVVASEMFVEAIGKMYDSIALFVSKVSFMVSRLTHGMVTPMEFGPWKSVSSFRKELDKRVEETWSKLMAMPSESVPEPAPNGALSIQSSSNAYLKDIAENTKSMNYNFQRIISGGSELGRSGATAVELHGLSKERRIAHAVMVLVDVMSAQSGAMQRAVNRAKAPMTA